VSGVAGHANADAARSAAVLPLDGLADGERAVLELVALDGLSVAEAAGILGIRPGTARVRLYRARWQLRQALTPQLTTEVTP